MSFGVLNNLRTTGQYETKDFVTPGRFNTVREALLGSTPSTAHSTDNQTGDGPTPAENPH